MLDWCHQQRFSTLSRLGWHTLRGWFYGSYMEKFWQVCRLGHRCFTQLYWLFKIRYLFILISQMAFHNECSEWKCLPQPRYYVALQQKTRACLNTTPNLLNSFRTSYFAFIIILFMPPYFPFSTVEVVSLEK
jgi:hypothetical protein